MLQVIEIDAKGIRDNVAVVSLLYLVGKAASGAVTGSRCVTGAADTCGRLDRCIWGYVQLLADFKLVPITAGVDFTQVVEVDTKASSDLVAEITFSNRISHIACCWCG